MQGSQSTVVDVVPASGETKDLALFRAEAPELSPAGEAVQPSTGSSWLASPSISVTAAVQAISASPPAPAALPDAGAPAGPAPLRLRLKGQVCRKRHLSKNLMFLTLRQAETCAVWDPDAPRVQTIAKLQSLGPEQMGDIKRLVKLGDILQVEGTVHAGAMGPEVQLERCAVVERWAVSCRGTGFKPDIEPPSDTCGGAPTQLETTWTVGGVTSSSGEGAALVSGEDSAPLCKFWVNTGVCKRVGCRFSHGKDGDKRTWKEIRTEWQRERRLAAAIPPSFSAVASFAGARACSLLTYCTGACNAAARSVTPTERPFAYPEMILPAVVAATMCTATAEASPLDVQCLRRGCSRRLGKQLSRAVLV